MTFVKPQIHGKTKYYRKTEEIISPEGLSLDRYFFPEYNKKKKRWDWTETILTAKRKANAKEIGIAEILEIMNGL